MTKKPWVKLYQGFPEDIQIPDATLYETLADSAARWPEHNAMLYMGRQISFAELIREVDTCAAAFASYGIKVHDSVVLSLPNMPGAIICFYALNKIGARAVMTHPLSSPVELKHYISISDAHWAVTVDMFYPVFRELARETGLKRLVITRFSDYLSRPKKIGFAVTKGRKIAGVPGDDPLVIRWKDFLATGAATGAVQPYVRPIEPDDGSVILFSGGTTNMPKGIELSSANFNALAVSMSAISGLNAGDSVLAILPVFHGFGLGLCIHTTMSVGGYFILVPEFSAEIYINNLIKHNPSFIAGVPTLFQALMGHSKFAKVSFDRLKGAYSGGDMLSADLKRRFDEAIMSQNSRVELMEGYGLTECVTACAVSPRNAYRDNSMGIPMPGMLVKVVDSATGEELPYGKEGEFCVSGPTLMKGYVKDPEATAQALREHADGLKWVHTGDLGVMDADGFVYFRQRIKRLIITSGYNVYPSQLENILEANKYVHISCVIGVKDPYKIQKVKAFIVLKPGYSPSDGIKEELFAYCRKNIAKYAIPYDIEFRDDLPKTLVGKVAYRKLEEEEMNKVTA